MLASIFELDNQIIKALVWTLIHSFWQFVVIALLMSVLLKLYQEHKSTVKYYIALASLALSFLTAIITFCYFYLDSSGSDITILGNDIAYYTPAANSEHHLIVTLRSWIEHYQLPVFYTWMMGVILFWSRFIMSVLYVEFLSGTSTPVYCQSTFKSFRRVCLHYKVSENITIGESKYVKSPMILGFFKPIILFPIGVINQLDISETEAILAHELAHFVRKDIYVNIIQNLMEGLLYYHPAIWWISANIRLERESCCDDLAVGYLGDNIHYARTLVKLQEISQNGNSPILALNFSKNESFFSNRIKRILNMTQTRNYLKEKIITSIVLVAILIFVTKDMTGSSKQTVETIGISDQPQNELVGLLRDTLPSQKESIRIQKKTADKEVKLSMEDGKIVELEIDGKKIEKDDYNLYEDIIADVKPNKSRNRNNHMFYFDGNNDEPFLFKYGEMNMDSIMKDFNISNMDYLKDIKMYEMDSEFMGKQMKQLQGELGKMQKLQEQTLSKEKMEQLRKEFGNLKFNFDGLDSINFKFENFDFPKMRERILRHEGDIYRQDGAGQGFDFNDNFKGFEYENDSKNFSEAIGNSLNRDGLLIPGKDNKVELTGKQLKINGEKQPGNIFEKYKRIFEETSGTTLEKNSKLQFNYTGKESKRKYRVY